jgi:ABC-type lipoprotein release transport system permease subunit
VLEPHVSDIPAKVSEGRMVETTGEIVLGKAMAERLDVRLGERLALDVSSLAGPQAAGLITVGFINSGLTAIDETTVFIHLDDARNLTGVTTATGLALDVARGEETEVSALVQKQLPDGVVARDLMNLLGALNTELEANRIQMIPIMLIFAIFAALAVTSTLLVSVLERKREFGMIASIGLAPRKLSWMIVMESVLVTTAGWLIGLLLGYGLNYLGSIYNLLGPLFSATSDAFASFGLGNEIHTTNLLEYALFAGVTILFAAIFAILIPARRVSKLEPVEAMRDE